MAAHLSILRIWFCCFALFLAPAGLWAQPAYKLDVKQGLAPRATLKLDGLRVVRTAVADDPGFRLQWHFKKDDKTVATPLARGERELEIPVQEPGTYTVVLELFHPAYKGGVVQKGEFRPVSNVLHYRLEAPAKPGEPVRLTLIDTPPALSPQPLPKK